MVMCESPILTLGQLDALHAQPERPALTLSMTYDVAGGAFAFRSSLEQLSRDAVAAVRSGVVILVLSDRDVDRERAPLPALLVTSVVAQALDREGLGTRAGLVIDTGEVRDAHQAAALLAFGASALCPWLAYTTAERVAAKAALGPREAVTQYPRRTPARRAQDHVEDGRLHGGRLSGQSLDGDRRPASLVCGRLLQRHGRQSPAR